MGLLWFQLVLSGTFAGRRHIYRLGSGLHAESEQHVARTEPKPENGSAFWALGWHPRHLHPPPPHFTGIPSVEGLSKEQGRHRLGVREKSAYTSLPENFQLLLK